MTVQQLLEARANAIWLAREVTERADGENREPTAEESAHYDRCMEEFDRLDGKVQERQKLEAAERALTQAASEPPRPAIGDEPEGRDDPRATAEYRRAFNGYLNGDMRELRALQMDLDTSGGYLVPTQFVADLITGVDNLVFIRGLATTFQAANAESLGIPSLENDPADPIWTAELAIGDEDSTMSFGKRELHPHPLAKSIKVSNKLLRAAVMDPEALVRQRLAYKFAATQENAFLNGSGAGQPLGVFTASANGINTDRDVSTGNTTTSITFDGLIEAKFTLKGQYWPNASWIFHRDGGKQIAKLKDGEGQYIWRESVRVGEPDRLLGLPFMLSEYAPNTFTTGLYVGILGDFSNYWIADALSMTVQRLIELYAATNQTGFIGRLESDGMPALSEAFIRVKLA